MSITRRVCCGNYVAPGWVGAGGSRNPGARLGITMPGEIMRGKERSFAMAHIAESARVQRPR